MKNIKVMKTVEIRSINSDEFEVRGLLPTNSPSEYIYHKKRRFLFKEEIKPLAFSMAVEKEKPLLLINHDYSKELIVTKFEGKETSRGFEFTAIVKKNEISEEILLNIGEIKGLSFGFYVGAEQWNGNHRLIYSFEKLKEISILKGLEPCYSASEVVIVPQKEQFETTKDVRQWLNRKWLEIYKEQIADLKKVGS